MKLEIFRNRAGWRRVLLAVAGLLALRFASLFAQVTVNVVERGYNNFRTGANTSETVLTPENMKSSANRFHKRFLMKVDGKIEGSPLYASGVTIAGETH